MSDPNSLITQVSKEDAQKGGDRPGSPRVVNNSPKSANKKKKKKGFAGFFCCGKEEDYEDDAPQGNATGTSNTQNQRSQVPTPPPNGGYLLPSLSTEDLGKKCLVLDLDETLVHSSFKPIPNADFIIPVEIDDRVHQVYVVKRPGVDAFMKKMADFYELVVFTASLPKYADPVLDLLDIYKVVRHRLFRDACCDHKGNFVKDLGRLGRALKNVIIIDNSPVSYMFHPENAIPIDSWFDDPNDTELLDLMPFLEDLTKVDDVSLVLDQHRNNTGGGFYSLINHHAQFGIPPGAKKLENGSPI